jgi:hypothetical protein
MTISPLSFGTSSSGEGARGADPARTSPLAELAVIVLFSAAAALPAMLAPILPLIDLGGHVGRYAVQLDAGRSAALAQWYTFTWGLLPNLGIDILVQALAPLIGLEPAVHLIVGMIPSLMVSGMLLLSRAAHGRIGVNALFALPLSISLPYLYGFVNFALSIALAFHAMALWLALERRPALRTALFLPLGFALWLCHLVGWAVFSLVAGITTLVARRRAGLPWLRVLIGTALMTLPLLAGPLAGALMPHGNDPGPLFAMTSAPRKLSWLAMALADRWLMWDSAGVAVIVFAIYVGLRTRGFITHAGLLASGLVLLGLYLLMPDTIMGSRYADMRLAPVILALLVLCAAPGPQVDPRLRRWLLIAGCVLCSARLAGNAASMSISGGEFAETLQVIDTVPRGTTLISLYVDQCESWNLDRRRHIMGYALARRHVFDNGQWQLPSGQLIAIHNPAIAPFDRDPSSITFLEPCGVSPGLPKTIAAIPRGVRYLWVIRIDPRMPLPGWEPLRRSRDSVLYRRLPSQQY